MVYAYIEAILALLLHTFTASLFVWLAYAKVLMSPLDLPYFSYKEILFVVFAIKTLLFPFIIRRTTSKSQK